MNWQDVTESAVTGLGYELVECERSARGLLRIFIDRLDGNFVTVDDCEKVTRQLQYVFEVEEVDYQRLEVSSPGLDRPLRKSADYERFAGQEVEITLKVALGQRKKFRGVLERDGAGWRLVFSGGKDGDGGALTALNFVLDEVREARLVPVVDFKGRQKSKQAVDSQKSGGRER